ncbi:CTP synthase N-terminus-domain-containing protein [Hypoxylon argillaceum]|nr:CTP synthase N-terminus-domain-containing protein [Hypoxylon argillaceum]KAI1148055.1 CTP synthase N-terminus-domain-containing protein [Nemania diffusa]
MHYILVSGGVISGVGKGIIASSTGLLLQSLGFRVSCIKIDPYVSVDAGLMAPAEHGECFVLGSGSEVDLDLGNYERYLSLSLTGDNNITTGKIYLDVISRERKGDYLGRTVQIVPHVVDAIKDWIKRVAHTCVDGSGEEPDVCIIELGGTVGDIESMPFLEALTQLRHEAGSTNFATIMVSYVPVIHGEQKTKPTQHAVKSVRSHGLIPDVIACRCEKPLADSTIRKISLHCQMEMDQVVVVRDMPTIYQVPLLLREQKLVPLLLSKMSLSPEAIPQSRLAKGEELWEAWKCAATAEHKATVNIALVGKYVSSPDAYMSVTKALEHSAMYLRLNLNLLWIDAEHLEPEMQTAEPEKYQKAWDTLHTASGLIVPGGFGKRGVLGMMLASKWAREEKVPFLGVCLGFQVAVMQLARDACSLPHADSEEFDTATKEPVIVYMPELDRENMGGTMRLGLHETIFQEGSEWSKMRALYGGVQGVKERHRHRYEVNPQFVDRLQEAGISFIGKDETGQRMEIFEMKDHPYFVGTQFHAEYQSRVLDPSKPYLGFVAASESAACLDKTIKSQVMNGSK